MNAVVRRDGRAVEQEDSERARKRIHVFAYAIVGGFFAVLTVCVVVVALLISATGESSPKRARTWFETVVRVKAKPFKNIQHYTDQGIDFSHHFRFEYNDEIDLKPIIVINGLSQTDKSASTMHLNGLPTWFSPKDVSEASIKFRRDGTEPIVMIVDPQSKTLYYEFVHL